MVPEAAYRESWNWCLLSDGGFSLEHTSLGDLLGRLTASPPPPIGTGTSRAGTQALGAGDAKELPLFRNALQRVLPSIMELDSRADNEVLHRIGDEDLPGLCQPSNTCADVNGDPGQIIVADLTFAAVEPATDLDPHPMRLFGDGSRTAHGPARPIEGGQKPVTEGLDLAAAIALNFPSR